ncbi:hypothetical protein WICPIJ_004754 [Wickerhamomyces pijperi]|uniref:Uncharacterized protein n=1 Tax=Wickerhamomyces pijperi TaxID=599730 RepID=A0A9P8Q7F7_WICPI|nr:hypothetical protein WICPIJ_004754 [Wickerhamomyces pijperi]
MSRYSCLERFKNQWLSIESQELTNNTDCQFQPTANYTKNMYRDKEEEQEPFNMSGTEYTDKELGELEYVNFQHSTRSTLSKFKKAFAITSIGLIVYTLLTSNFLFTSFVTPIPPPPKYNVEEVTELYLNVLKTSNLAADWSKRYTSEPHLAGTNYPLVQFTADKFTEFGFNATVDSFETYINYPKNESFLTLKENGSVIYKPTLVEDVLEQDETTQGEDLIPAFHGYSANGNVTAEYIFANYGSIEDFRLLNASGVDVTGKIVVVRYGGLFRGLKVKFAQEAGAVGVLIYSDPADDHVDESEVSYPEGPGRNPSSIQRGSVQFLSELPGDPTRFLEDPYDPVALANLTGIPKIPSLPISYKEVQPILSKLSGHGLQLGFEGGIKGFDYSVGPAPGFELNIYNDNEYVFTNLNNVIGMYEGADPSNLIVIGNHRDAWIKGGAGDPNSGSTVLLEIARALGELFKLGFKPQASILLASWDGEEYGLIGSTSYAERYAKVLQKNVTAYLNCDVAVGGSYLKLASSPLLNDYLLDVADLVQYPVRGNESIPSTTLREHFLKSSTISILGSGSDYTVFYEHLGLTSVDVGFNSGKGDPVYHYHSNYDSFYWMSKYADPGFKLHNTMAQYLGLLLLRMSENKALTAFKAADFSTAINGYFTELADKIPAEWLNREIPTIESYQSPCQMRMMGSAPKVPLTLSNLIDLTNEELATYKTASVSFDAKVEELQSEWDTPTYFPWKKIVVHWKIFGANKKLRGLEQNFLYKFGLNNRDWFKHIGFASGRFTGYAGQSLPGLTEALEDGDFEEAVKWVGIIKKAVKKAGKSLV